MRIVARDERSGSFCVALEAASQAIVLSAVGNTRIRWRSIARRFAIARHPCAQCSPPCSVEGRTISCRRVPRLDRDDLAALIPGFSKREAPTAETIGALSRQALPKPVDGSARQALPHSTTLIAFAGVLPFVSYGSICEPARAREQ
jgi:hypothetical protein